MSSEKRKVWITGAGGLIGNQLVTQASVSAGKFEPFPLTRSNVDLTNRRAVETFYRAQLPDAIVHCAAMSRSPDCQRNPAEAQRQNVEVTRHLAELAADIPFVFMSTDLVFDGTKGTYLEADAVNPMSVYAETKVAAEEMLQSHTKRLIIRTSLNCGISPTGDRGMDEQLLRAWQRGVSMPLFEDEFRCPIPASATARAVWELLNQHAVGTFHIAGAERLSRWQIGELLTAVHPEYQQLITRGSLRDYRGAPRSPDTSLNCEKAQSLLGFALPKFSEWLQHEERTSN